MNRIRIKSYAAFVYLLLFSHQITLPLDTLTPQHSAYTTQYAPQNTSQYTAQPSTMHPSNTYANTMHTPYTPYTPQQAANKPFSSVMHKHSHDQSDNLDTSFGDGKGYVVTPDTGKAYAVAVQSDKKILVGGSHAKKTGNEPHTFSLARYRIDGSLDMSFGPENTGHVTTDVGSDAFIKTIAIQNDGKIVAAGSGVLVRYQSNGELDQQFGTNGIVSKSQSGMQDITTMIIHDNGKIIAAAGTNITQFNSDGTRDKVFDTWGKDNISRIKNITALIKTGEKTIAAAIGDVEVYSRRARRNIDLDLPVVMKYNSDGSLDSSFGNSGMSYFHDADDNYIRIVSCVLDGGSILVVAKEKNNDYYAALTFDSNGKAPDYANAEELISKPIELAIHQHKAYLMAQGPHFEIAKRNERLQLETSFGNNGVAELKILGKEAIKITSLCFQENNKFIAIGFTYDDEFVVARYHN